MFSCMSQDCPTATEIIGIHGGLREVVERVARVLGKPVDVLIEGESGTGKELIARALHAGDPVRRGHPFVAVNCAAIPEALVEAELFGAEKGSFTGATARTDGLFHQADRGTLFLDEVGELPLPVQPKLLRALQEKSVRRIGSGDETIVDVRILSATNVELGAATLDGRFRTDLYYRLAEFPIHLPPLRQRREDIPELAAHFVSRFSEQFRGDLKTLSATAVDRLCAYDWRRNNVRELSHVLKQAVLFADGPTIEAFHLPLPEAADPVPNHRFSMRSDASQGMQAALRQTNGNVAAAARLLGLSRSTLFDRLRKLGWSSPAK